MLPKSRRALTIQEITALARSSLHGNRLLGAGGPGGHLEKEGSPMGAGAGTLGEGIGVTHWSLGSQGVLGGTREEGMGVPVPKGWRQEVLGLRVTGFVEGTRGAQGLLTQGHISQASRRW